MNSIQELMIVFFFLIFCTFPFLCFDVYIFVFITVTVHAVYIRVLKPTMLLHIVYATCIDMFKTAIFDLSGNITTLQELEQLLLFTLTSNLHLCSTSIIKFLAISIFFHLTSV